MAPKPPTRLALVTAFFGVLTACMDPSLAGSGLVSSNISIAEAPAGVSEIGLRIRGQDFDPINLTVTPNTEAIILELPVGKNRLFEGRGGTYFARTIAAVTPKGVNVGLNFSPVLIVPDTDNSRLVQVWRNDDPAWEELTEAELGFTGFFPSDVDYDGGGRAYFTNDDGTEGGVYRVSSIFDTTETQLSSAGNTTSIAIDRDRQRVYFVAAGGPALVATNYSGSIEVPLDIGNFTANSRLAIDSQGYLYVTNGASGIGAGAIQKYDPIAETTVGTPVAIPYGRVEDIHFVGGVLYVVLSGTDAGQAPIVRLSSNLTFLGSLGTIASDPANAQPGEFYGPTGFVTDRRGRLVITDEVTDAFDNTYDRLVFLDPGNPGAWATFGTSGSGEEEFRF